MSTAPGGTVDPEFLGTPCPDCAVTVAHAALDEHLVEIHGHEPDTT